MHRCMSKFDVLYELMSGAWAGSPNGNYNYL